MVTGMGQIIKHLQQMVDMFFKITTGIIFVAAAYVTVFWGTEGNINFGILWQILGVSALCSLGTLFLICDGGREISKSAMLIRTIMDFLWVNIIVLFCGFQFEWYDSDNWKMIMGMETCIIVVFLLVTLANYFSEYRTAEKMNEKLKERE